MSSNQDVARMLSAFVRTAELVSEPPELVRKGVEALKEWVLAGCEEMLNDPNLTIQDICKRIRGEA